MELQQGHTRQRGGSREAFRYARACQLQPPSSPPSSRFIPPKPTKDEEQAQEGDGPHVLCCRLVRAAVDVKFGALIPDGWSVPGLDARPLMRQLPIAYSQQHMLYPQPIFQARDFWYRIKKQERNPAGINVAVAATGRLVKRNDLSSYIAPSEFRHWLTKAYVVV